MPAVQTTYNERMPVAAPGLLADMRNWDGISRNCETSAGIGYGLACGRGDTDPVGGAKVGGTLPDFLGVSQRDVTVEAAASNPDKYVQNTEMGILTQGTIWVQVSGTPGPDDPVHYNATTGVFAASGGTGPIVGARWMTETTTSTPGAVAVCKLHLGGNNQAAA